MNEQKVVNALIKKGQNIRNQGPITNKKLNELLKYQLTALKAEKDDDELFSCCISKPKSTAFNRDWSRAYSTLSRIQKASLYLNTCNLINHVDNKNLKSVSEDFQKSVFVKNSGLLGGWDLQEIQIQTKNKKILFKQSGKELDLRQYLTRHSKQQVRSYFVLESTVKMQNQNQSIRIAPQNPEEYGRLYTTISQLCFQAFKQQIIYPNSKQLPFLTNRQTSFQTVMAFQKRQKTFSQIQIVQRKQSFKLENSGTKSIKQLNKVNFREVIKNLDQFQGFLEPQKNVFEQKSGNRIKKMYFFDSKDRHSVLKHLFNYCYFYRFKQRLSSVALIRKLGDFRVQIKEVYMNFQGRIIECSYCRQRKQTQDKVYFIDSLFRIRYDRSQSLLDQSCLNNLKLQNSYAVTEVKNMENGKIRVLSQGLVQFRFDSKSKESFTKIFLGVFSLIKLQSSNVQSRTSTTTQNLKSTLNPIVKNQSQKFYNYNTQVKAILEHKYKNNIECRQKGASKLLVWQKGVHFIWGKQWKVFDKGGLLFINQQKRKAQSNLLGSILKSLGKQILKGQSVVNMPMPIQVNGSYSFLEDRANCSVYAPLLFQKAVRQDQISRFKAAVCFQLSQQVVASKYTDKQFNPILGETYQGFIDGCPIYGQQISHHPPISAIYLHGRGYNYSACIQPILKIGLNSGTGVYRGQRKVTFKQFKKIKQQTIKMTGIDFLMAGIAFGDRILNFQKFFQVYDEDNRLFCRIQFGKNKKKGDCQINHYQDFIYGKLLRVKYGFDFKSIKQISKQKILQEIGVFQGRWTQNVKFNDQVIFDLESQVPFVVEECTNTLDSHSNNRKDIQFKRANKLQEGQNAKQELEKLQRKDAKLRKLRKQRSGKF